jgi:3-deoxy-7-phosphoheptulonate synthase
MKKTEDVNIEKITPLDPPGKLKAELPLTAQVSELVFQTRQEIQRILTGQDPRLLVVVGPCSIHDPSAALDYARRLVALRRDLGDRLLILMRVYFEKPRTTIGWRGLLYDPHLNDTCDIPGGLRLGRRLLLDILSLGLPVASEMLDPISPQYLADLVSWSAIGARTTESQTHRDMASGLSMPVGFKNSTDGNLQIALDAMLACKHPHAFLGIDQDGKTAVVHTRGNSAAHVVLRGGKTSGPNYDAKNIAHCLEQLRAHKLPTGIMVDCSHSNSGKRHEQQEVVFNNVLEQRVQGTHDIIGMMVESNIFPGAQKLPADRSQLKYGVSLTDECIGWETTDRLLRQAHSLLAPK